MKVERKERERRKANAEAQRARRSAEMALEMYKWLSHAKRERLHTEATEGGAQGPHRSREARTAQTEVCTIEVSGR